jgi:signal transduction histidine kinase
MGRRIDIDWKTVAGFGGLLFLIIAIGISQIQGLSGIVTTLAKRDLAIQKAVLEMKSSNSSYGMGIRNYMFWRGAKFLEAAGAAEKLDLALSASKNFDKQLDLYVSLISTPQQNRWAQTVKKNEEELRQIVDKIITFVDESHITQGKGREEFINRLLMKFENKLYQIDAFLEDPIQRFNLREIDRRLVIAEIGRQRSVGFLRWSLIIGVFLGGQTVFLIYQRSRREQERRELLTRRVIKVEEEQRNNLSLQVHDQMGQDLSALKIYLGLIDEDLSDETAGQREKIQKAKMILTGLMDKAHNISELLRPPELDDVGLAESIGALILRYKEMTNCSFMFKKPDDEVKLPPEYSLTLYRVTQEALTNITKHSMAKHVEVVLKKAEEEVYLDIIDDGVGFNYKALLERPARRKEDKVKLGLNGLKERVELLGGKLNIHTSPHHGTRLEVVLPIME